MSEVKRTLYGELLNTNKEPFTASGIRAKLGVAKQTLDYHLRTMTDEGILNKVGSSYVVNDAEEIIARLVQGSQERISKKAQNTVYFENAKEMNGRVTALLALKALDAPSYEALTKAFRDAIDDTINELTNLKRGLTATPRSRLSLLKGDLDTIKAQQVGLLEELDLLIDPKAFNVGWSVIEEESRYV